MVIKCSGRPRIPCGKILGVKCDNGHEVRLPPQEMNDQALAMFARLDCRLCGEAFDLTEVSHGACDDCLKLMYAELEAI